MAEKTIVGPASLESIARILQRMEIIAATGGLGMPGGIGPGSKLGVVRSADDPPYLEDFDVPPQGSAGNPLVANLRYKQVLGRYTAFTSVYTLEPTAAVPILVSVEAVSGWMPYIQLYQGLPWSPIFPVMAVRFRNPGSVAATVRVEAF